MQRHILHGCFTAGPWTTPPRPSPGTELRFPTCPHLWHRRWHIWAARPLLPSRSGTAVSIATGSGGGASVPPPRPAVPSRRGAGAAPRRAAAARGYGDESGAVSAAGALPPPRYHRSSTGETPRGVARPGSARMRPWAAASPESPRCPAEGRAGCTAPVTTTSKVRLGRQCRHPVAPVAPRGGMGTRAGRKPCAAQGPQFGMSTPGRCGVGCPTPGTPYAGPLRVLLSSRIARGQRVGGDRAPKCPQVFPCE